MSLVIPVEKKYEKKRKIMESIHSKSNDASNSDLGVSLDEIWTDLISHYTRTLIAQGSYNGQPYFGDLGHLRFGMLNNYHLHHDSWGSDCTTNSFR